MLAGNLHLQLTNNTQAILFATALVRKTFIGKELIRFFTFNSKCVNSSVIWVYVIVMVPKVITLTFTPSSQHKLNEFMESTKTLSIAFFYNTVFECEVLVG